MRKSLSRYDLSIYAFLLTVIVLGVVQWRVDMPMMLAERFLQGAGWPESIVIALYAGWIVYKMRDPRQSARWRSVAWNIFTIVFFGQLILGLLGHDLFLMTGELHLPVPMMILSGPMFRWHISFMPILFVSTLIISGPAWCSQLCYFGALDNMAAGSRKNLRPISGRFRIKHVLLLLIIVLTLIFRFAGVSTTTTTMLAGGFGIAGLAIILLVSRVRGKMVHCVIWCPIGTVVNYLKYISPFRMYIDESCTNCMACARFCKYDALNREDILNRKPGPTCTYCGDCLASCKTDSIRYQFPGLGSAQARNCWIVLTISLHAIFMALARI